MKIILREYHLFELSQPYLLQKEKPKEDMASFTLQINSLRKIPGRWLN